MSNITFKFLSSDGPARRLSYTSMPTWADLAGKLEGTFAIPKACVALAYIDTDGDEIILNSDEEVRDCVETAAAMRGGNGNTPNELATVIRCRVLDLSTLRNGGTERPSARSFTPAPAGKDSDIASSATAESIGYGVHAIQHAAGEGEEVDNEIINATANGGDTSTNNLPTDLEGDGVSNIVECIEIDHALGGTDEVSESRRSTNGDEDNILVLVDVHDHPRHNHRGCVRGRHDHHGHRSFRFDPHARGRGGFGRGGRCGLGRGGPGFGGLGRGGFASTHIPPFPHTGSPPSPPSPGASASPFHGPAPDSPDMHARGMGRGVRSGRGGRGGRGGAGGMHGFYPFGGPFGHENGTPPLSFRHEHFHHHSGPARVPPFPPPPFVPPPMMRVFAADSLPAPSI